jgi:hypothetical protein
MTGGLTHRSGIPFGTWQDRYMDWFRDLGFLQKPGVETKAAKEITAFLSQPQRGGGPRGGASGQRPPTAERSATNTVNAVGAPR